MKICIDLKIIALLMGMLLSYTKYCCFLCLWDSRDRNTQSIQDKLPSRILKSGVRNVLNDPLINSNDILLPSLHIKLGLMKNFVKSMNKDGEAFQYLRSKFPRLSDAKIKEEIFKSSQICKIMKHLAFHQILEEKEKAAWKAFKSAVRGFLGRKKMRTINSW